MTPAVQVMQTGSRLLCGLDFGHARRDYDIDLAPDELGRECDSALRASLRPAILDRDVATVDPSEIAQALHEGGGALACDRGGGRARIAYGSQLVCLLRARCERPRGYSAAKQRDEVATFQLIGLHSVPASQGRITRYRIGEDQSGGNETILQPGGRSLSSRWYCSIL